MMGEVITLDELARVREVADRLETIEGAYDSRQEYLDECRRRTVHYLCVARHGEEPGMMDLYGRLKGMCRQAEQGDLSLDDRLAIAELSIELSQSGIELPIEHDERKEND